MTNRSKFKCFIGFLFLLFFIYPELFAQQIVQDVNKNTTYSLSLKTPGNLAKSYLLQESDGILHSLEKLPVRITKEVQSLHGKVILILKVEALEEVWFNLEGKFIPPGFNYDSSYLYLPGFWYRKNLRSPEGAPSARTSKSWIVSENRLSSPLTGIFNREKKQSYSIARLDKISKDVLLPIKEGEVILSGHSDLGALGFGEDNNNGFLSFSYPYKEAPHSYFRKLTLGEPITTFLYLKKGESVTLNYQVLKFEAENYAEYIEKVWTYSYDIFEPKPLSDNKLTDNEIKGYLTNFYKESYVDAGELKGYSGIHLLTDVCEVRPILEVGFIGRILLNAFNALEYGEKNNDQRLKQDAYSILNSYEENGFSKSGFIRELVDFEKGKNETIYSIRRQSEGIYAALLYLDYEKKKGRTHLQWEKNIRELLDKMLQLQESDGSYPRKFEGNLELIDGTGGSSPSAVVPLVMAYKFFNEKKYLNSARRVIDYIEREIISKSDYFSSTLDADCEDKEASLYAATALYYMAMVSNGKEHDRYVKLAKQASFFTLSWYYTWDVPFAPGQMLGDVGLKTRGWGNVSVENNHIDVFIFEFDEVLNWLAKETGESRFSEFSNVIRSSMREQLLPYKDHMVNIGKIGYYPEVVQHANWDYGYSGKGFYNKHFAPGWTVASIWELLTEGRAREFLTRNR